MIDPQPLLDSVACINCMGASIGQQLKIALLLQIAQAQGTAVNIQALLDQAACLVCIGVDLATALEIVLLSQIAAGGGGGGAGAGCMLSTAGDPEGVLTSTCTPALAVDPATKAIYLFTGTAGTNTGWILKI